MIKIYPYKDKAKEISKLTYKKLPDQLKDDLSDLHYPNGTMYFYHVEEEWNAMTQKQREEFVSGIHGWE